MKDMTRMRFFLMTHFVFTLLFSFAPLAGAEEPETLTANAVLAVEGPRNLQPSGLTRYGDRLLFISDKHELTIFELIIDEKTAKVLPFLSLMLPEEFKKTTVFDWEGITVGENNRIYLVSEKRSAIFTVTEKDPTLHQIPLDILSVARPKNLLQKRNAGLEGICLLPDGTILLAAEREERGIIECTLSGAEPLVSAYPCEQARYPFPSNRSPDFADLFYWNNRIFAIERNADLLVELSKKDNAYQEVKAWSFQQILSSEDYLYSDMSYGMAEGFYIDDKNIYVILDNNGIHRKMDPSDDRPLLLIFDIPQSMRKD